MARNIFSSNGSLLIQDTLLSNAVTNLCVTTDNTRETFRIIYIF